MPGALHTVAYGPPAGALLARLIASAKADDPFAPVTVAVPSAAAGTTLRRRIAAEQGGLVGVSFRSLPQVAEALAGPAPRSADLSPMAARAHLRAVLRAGSALTPDPAVATSPATEAALAITFAELAPLDEDALTAVASAEPLAAAVVDLFRRYRLAARLPADGHDPAAAAAARVRATTSAADVVGNADIVGGAGPVGATATAGPAGHDAAASTGDPGGDGDGAAGTAAAAVAAARLRATTSAADPVGTTAASAADLMGAAATAGPASRDDAASASDPVGTTATAGSAGVASVDAELAAIGRLIVYLPRRVRPGEVALLAALAERIPVDAVVGRTGEPHADVVADELAVALAPALGEARWAGGPPATPAHPTTLIRAPDPAEEVAMVVREVVAAITGDPAADRPPVRPERIAVLHRVRHPYSALLHAGLDAAGVPHHGAAVTTLAQTVPGRVLVALLDVQAGGFRRADVARLWRAGPLLDPATGRPVRASRWDRLAREAGVGGGLDQWRARLARAIESREVFVARWRELDAAAAAAAGVEPEPREDDHRIAAWRALGEHIEALAERLRPPTSSTWAAWSTWLLDLLVDLVQPAARTRQPEAFERIDDVVRGLVRLDGIEGPPDLELLRRVLEPELERPDRRHGRFGHGVAVGRLVDGVGADLDLVVVVGAADGDFPPRRPEDPLLADRARDLAGGALARRGLRREEEQRDLLAALAAAPRRVLTAPRADTRNQRERQAAAWFVAGAGHLAGRMVGSAELAGLRGEPWFVDVPSFEAHPAAMAGPASVAELDLGDLLAAHHHLDDDPAAVTAGVVATADADLGRGLRAADARRSGRFDEWSGRVGPDDALIVDADRPRSPTGLEKYAECPFRSYLGDVLRVGAIDDPTEAELISAIDEGSLVHEILETFVGGHAGKPPSEPWSDEERDELDAVAARIIGRYEAEGRTGRPLLWDVRRQQLRHQLRRVLDSDEQLRARDQVAPAAVELAFGDLALDGPGEASAPPVQVVLADGRTVRFKGIADRVDRSVDGRRLVVYDYKTGSSAGFYDVAAAIRDEGDITARGTKLQLPIYALAARTRFPDAEEVSSYYWFVGRRDLGRTIGAVVDERAEARFREVLDVVVDGIEAGRFPANPGDERWSFGQWTFDHCSWCEYDRICPTSRGEAWVRVRTAPELDRYRRLADPEPEPAEPEPEPEAGSAS